MSSASAMAISILHKYDYNFYELLIAILATAISILHKYDYNLHRLHHPVVKVEFQFYISTIITLQ